ncbi:hypothetical protein OG352_09270 [Streptomyces sp. NBC_01485]|uniref:hypothetical protein n=1 Tax=Streptomyces sp. NBC_01485 TaxID=2903884 RepID=UPI002E349AC8|nr:hypothetical protein [Streptomyces sp. NBC_01485]
MAREDDSPVEEPLRVAALADRLEVFAEAGFGEAVELAEAGADRAALVRALPPAAAATVGLVGDLDAVRARIDAYAEAGLDEIALVPATAGDRRGSGR